MMMIKMKTYKLFYGVFDDDKIHKVVIEADSINSIAVICYNLNLKVLAIKRCKNHD